VKVKSNNSYVHEYVTTNVSANTSHSTYTCLRIVSTSGSILCSTSDFLIYELCGRAVGILVSYPGNLLTTVFRCLPERACARHESCLSQPSTFTGHVHCVRRYVIGAVYSVTDCTLAHATSFASRPHPLEQL